MCIRDSFCLTLVNSRIIRPEHFEPQESGAVFLNDAGRKAVLAAWQEKKRDTLTPVSYTHLKAKVSFGLELDEDGTLLDVVSFLTEQARGKKMVLAPRVMEVPMPVNRSSGVAPNFLCDNSGYLLGDVYKRQPLHRNR